MRSRQLSAFNTAAASDNKIHDDEVARRFGFSGGLVPGVEVYAYLSWGPVSEHGRAWLERGVGSTRFRLPTYDGHQVTVAWEDGRAELRNPDGEAVSELTAELGAAGAVAPALDSYAAGLLPPSAERPPASPTSLTAGRELGEITHRFDFAGEGEVYLADVREVLQVYWQDRLAHPGWVLRWANAILARNVLLGPWIHVGSAVRNYGVVGDGAEVVARGRVAAEYERKGHRFVDLDVVVAADGATVAHIDHIAIYRPRQVAEA
jgi:hypothetical protein